MIGDNIRKANITIKYAKELNTYLSQCSIFTPYPGTPVFKEYSDKINVNSFEKFNQYNLVFDHPSYDNRSARSTLDKFYNSYYLRFSWLQKFLRQIFF